jgi:hypothetical protein
LPATDFTVSTTPPLPLPLPLPLRLAAVDRLLRALVLRFVPLLDARELVLRFVVVLRFAPAGFLAPELLARDDFAVLVDRFALLFGVFAAISNLLLLPSDGLPKWACEDALCEKLQPVRRRAGAG